jgi:hypothetical protein
MRFTWFLLAAGCGPLGPANTDTAHTGDSATDPVCSTDSYWTGGDEESPRMHPGGDCVSCHARGEGPDFTLAGTVMGDWDDPTDCNGIAGVTVHVTDANGGEHTLTTNSAGNFYTTEHLLAPIAVVLEQDGRTREMQLHPDETDCMSCHTQDGEEGAPGRIVAP